MDKINELQNRLIFKIFFFIVILIFLSASAVLPEDSSVKIGVLAKRGTNHCLSKWSPTADYLTRAIPEKKFKIIPIGFKQIDSTVAKGEVDFILANPSIYVEMESHYRVNRIATLKNKRTHGVHTTFGSVIFYAKKHLNINHIHEFKDKTFMGVHETAFGGWIMAWREFKEAGINPFTDFSSISYGGTQDAVVYAVQDGKVDVGIVRTDTLERMQDEGKIRIDDFHVFHDHGGGKVHLPYLHSTRTYPEWPFAKLKHTSNELAEKVSVALIDMPADSDAAIAGKCAGWTIPLNYQSVHDSLKFLKVAPYKNFGQITIQGVMKKYWHSILILTISFIGMMISIAFFIKLNRNIRFSEKKLRESENRLQSIFKAAPTGIGIGTNRVLGRTNKKISEITGYSPEELLGNSARLLYIDDDEYGKAGIQINDQIKKYGNGTIETCWKQKNGKIIDVLLSFAPIDQSDVSKGITFTVLDITDSKRMKLELAESEEKYRSMMETMPDPVYICSPDYRVEYMNPAMISRTGCDAVGEFCYKALHDFDEKCSWCNHDKAQQGESIKLDVFSPKDKRSFHISQSPIVHSNRFISIMTIFKDTTKMVKLESQLRQAQKMESLGTLAGGIAHDFNNILFPILGYSEMLIDEVPDDSTLKHDLMKIFKGAQRAKDLVQQILTFSRQREQELKPLKVQLVVKEAIKLIRSSLPATIEINLDVKKDCGLVMADPTQIHQIIMNLITNAYHAMEKTGGNLDINLRKVELGIDELIDSTMEPGAYVCLTVADTGEGMDKSITDRIFDPYFTTKEEGKGTGLGLSVVHGIVKSHGGHISVYSEPGEGTQFHVYLPEIQTQEETQTIKVLLPLEKGCEKVLLVDDRQEIVFIIARMLDKLGYHVTSRTSSIEALEAFRADPLRFDLVITDLTMPNMTGDKLASEIMKIRPDIPIILCTGFSEMMSKKKTKSLGIKGFLMKPVVMKDLASTVRRVLDKI